MPAANSTSRFSNRVDDYIRYRPGYPVELLDLLADRADLSPESVVVDVGSGTGILAKLFLDNGNSVIGVEPNKEMREAAEALLGEYARFQSVDARAESTRLPPEFADFVTAGQAFHWFDAEATRREFVRILKPEGRAVIVFNDRRTDSTEFLRGYEALLRTLEGDYTEINHKRIDDEVMLKFFGGRAMKARFDNLQRFDLQGLIGRVASSSYCPPRDDPRFKPLVEKLTALFEQHQVGGKVVFEYDCIAYYGHLL